jgi:hypothetical protein
MKTKLKLFGIFKTNDDGVVIFISLFAEEMNALEWKILLNKEEKTNSYFIVPLITKDYLDI